ncbi:glycosyl-phosphatidylinositol-anchored molecule-like protein [Cavia porcellus]|uniref:glycosyl-phosphatidylinositol-anchored molecule-like protein n=1 Tax=Cavia porcellus TaxID=10141 RepID=UPI002FE1F3C8
MATPAGKFHKAVPVGLMLPFALLLVMELPGMEANVTEAQSQWTFNVECFDCELINTFACHVKRRCVYAFRRCMTVSIRVSPRELLVFKNCTWNCTFVYTALQPPETPRQKLKTNSFYFTHCCNGMGCNDAGPTNVERDIEDAVLEDEVISESVRLMASAFFLIFASIVATNTLMRETLLGGV